MAKTLVGVVSSTAQAKTIVVTVSEHKIHPLYHKAYSSSKKYLAHDENNQAALGDTVLISETRPLSANKHFKLDKVIQKAPVRHIENNEESAEVATEKAK